jgi:hypothetical protein
VRLGLAVTAVAVTVLESTGLGVAPHERYPRIEHAFEAKRPIGLWRNVIGEDVRPDYDGATTIKPRKEATSSRPPHPSHGPLGGFDARLLQHVAEARYLADLPFAYTRPARL